MTERRQLDLKYQKKQSALNPVNPVLFCKRNTAPPSPTRRLLLVSLLIAEQQPLEYLAPLLFQPMGQKSQ
ncbi:MAG: hypothetical protein ACR2PX_08855 [Endozoicomonas sp.]